eukprot:GHVT01045305.1.p1 GENE.GHVT01045305.1~~GHVT01045305.1.p1  ORF type:complete len:432 (-),score=28.08 GHVT01045305.1:2227-3522(-)
MACLWLLVEEHGVPHSECTPNGLLDTESQEAVPVLSLSNFRKRVDHFTVSAAASILGQPFDRLKLFWVQRGDVPPFHADLKLPLSDYVPPTLYIDTETTEDIAQPYAVLRGDVAICRYLWELPDLAGGHFETSNVVHESSPKARTSFPAQAPLDKCWHDNVQSWSRAELLNYLDTLALQLPAGQAAGGDPRSVQTVRKLEEVSQTLIKSLPDFNSPFKWADGERPPAALMTALFLYVPLRMLPEIPIASCADKTSEMNSHRIRCQRVKFEFEKLGFNKYVGYAPKFQILRSFKYPLAQGVSLTRVDCSLSLPLGEPAVGFCSVPPGAPYCPACGYVVPKDVGSPAVGGNGTVTTTRQESCGREKEEQATRLSNFYLWCVLMFDTLAGGDCGRQAGEGHALGKVFFFVTLTSTAICPPLFKVLLTPSVWLFN